MTRESRDELLERILEETARNPYKPGSRKKQPVSQSGKTIDGYTAKHAAPDVPKPVQPERTPDGYVPKHAAPEKSQPIAKPQIGNDEITQIFSNAEINEMAYKSEPQPPRVSPARRVPEEIDIAKMQEQSAADRIQRIKQTKAAMAKAAVMRKAELDNSIMMQNGFAEAAEAPVFSDNNDEKVNVILPKDEYLSDFSDESDELGECENFEDFVENEDAVVRSASAKIGDVIQYVMTAFVIIFMLFNYIMRFTVIDGKSMEPTLKAGNIILTKNAAYTPKNGDIVTINNKTAALLDENGNITEKKGLGCKIAKRIIALGGDTVDIDFEKGIIKVNDKELTEKYISEPTTLDSGAFTYPLTIPEGYAYVLSDNRNSSKDSRHEDIGLIPVDEIEGEMIFSIVPFGKIN